MVKDIGYQTINIVLESWESIRRIKNYNQVAGVMLFQRLFTKCPDAKGLFGFSNDCDPYREDVYQSKRFITHASYLIDMIDTALNMLGPDIELLTESMVELGMKHHRYGVKIAYFPIMGECLFETLQEILPLEAFPSATQDAWRVTYQALSDDMIKGHKVAGLVH